MQLALSPHHVEDEERFAIASIEDSAGWFDQLPVSPARQLRRRRAAVRKPAELFDAREDTLNERPCGLDIVECDVVGDGIEIAERRFGPNYLSHRAMRVLAFACVTTRFSSTARSPRAMPSSTATLRWSAS